MALQDELISIEAKIEVEQGDLQKRLQESTGNAQALRKEVEQLEKAIGYLTVTEGEGSQKVRDYTEELKNKKKQLKETAELNRQLGKTMDINSMSFTQLKNKSKELRQTLNSLSKELNPAEWEKFNTELKRVEQRMKEVKAGGKSVDNTLGILNNKFVKITGWFAVFKQGVGILGGLGSNVLKTFAKETNLAGDKIEATFTGIKFSFSSMIRSVTTGELLPMDQR